MSIVNLTIAQIPSRSVGGETELKLEAILGVRWPQKWAVLRESEVCFSTVDLVIPNEGLVAVGGIESRMKTRGKNGAGTDDYQSRQDKVSRMICHNQKQGAVCSVVCVVGVDREDRAIVVGIRFFNHSQSCHVGSVDSPSACFTLFVLRPEKNLPSEEVNQVDFMLKGAVAVL